MAYRVDPSLPAAPTVVKRADYRPPEFLVDHVRLHINIAQPLVTVHNVMALRRNPAGKGKGPLVLEGEYQTLQTIIVDGHALAPKEYVLTPHTLTIKKPPEAGVVEVISTHDPHKNTALSGLYASGGGMLNTQMEPEGFRRFTYYPDRPDVLATFTTRIEADAKNYPVLLSNGNLIKQGKLAGGRHFAEWEDPHPKPCYLFALVAGKLAVVKDQFQTRSGRKVAIEFYVMAGQEKLTDIARKALKDAMAWDERAYGLEYDLDRFMVVATPFFNMGAMENKGLNIFNSDCVLADPATTTDGDIEFVERVVAHEYFHNWTGNRITCRDWFQLSLKEGLTVFREQQFMEQQHDVALMRVAEVRGLRSRQFAEDAGPTAHPVRPDQYQSIDNFYTATVYEKGAEVCRMLHTLVGDAGWRMGMQTYVQRHDGQAATCDQFVAAMADANRKDFAQFMRWYSQAGTPTLYITTKYDARKKVSQLMVKQTCPPTPGQAKKQPFHLPLSVGLLDHRGRALFPTRVLEMTKPSQVFVFHNVATKPIFSLPRGFSAPVRIDFAREDAELYLLLAHDADLFGRYDAAQQLYKKYLLSAVGQKKLPPVPPALLEALKAVLVDASMAPSFKAMLLNPPSELELGLELENAKRAINPDDVHAARDHLRISMAAAMETEWLETYNRQKPDATLWDGQTMGQRALKNLSLAYLCLLNPKKYAPLATKQTASKNMTEVLAALSALVRAGGKAADDALAAFAKKWGKNDMVMHKWLAVQAGAQRADVVARIKKLLKHPAYDCKNPNAVRSLLGVLGKANEWGFHAADGSGYALLAEEIAKLDALNPPMAARLVLSFERWRAYEPKRQKLMQAALQTLVKTGTLSPNTAEQVGRVVA